MSTVPVVKRLYPYQREACNAAIRALKRGLRKIVLCQPTASGKTFTTVKLVAGLLEAFRKQGTKANVLWIAHREELVNQALTEFAESAPDLRVTQWDSKEKDATGDVVVAMIGSTRTLRDPFTIVVVDEAHHLAAEDSEAGYHGNMYTRLLKRIKWGYLIGLTATPTRLDGRQLDFEEVAYSIRFLDLVRARRLARPIYMEVLTKEAYSMATSKGDFTNKSLQKLDNPVRNAKVADIYMKNRAQFGKTLMFVTGVEHCYHMMEEIQKRDPSVAVAVLTGQDNKQYRREVLEWFRAGPPYEQKLVVNCFDDQTEILSNRGWLRGDEVRVGDQVMALDTEVRNPGLNRMRWVPVTHMLRRPLEVGERMVHIHNQGLDIRVTEGHRMLVRTGKNQRWKISEAKQLTHRQGPYRLPLSGHLEPVYQQSRLKGLNLDHFRFLGLFATDGTYNKERSSITIAQRSDSITCAEIEGILDGCGFDWSSTRKTVTTDVDGHQYTLDVTIYRVPKGNIGGQLARTGWYSIPMLAKGPDKSLSYPELNDMTEAQFDALLRGLWLGDGDKSKQFHNRPNAGIRLFGADRALFDNVQAWAVGRGWASSCTWRTQMWKGEQRPIATLRLRQRTDVQTNNHTVATSGGNPATFDEQMVGEEVWCLTNELGTVVTRRNGRVAITGQCELFTEGFDAPSCKTIMLARPTMSKTLWMQMVGRGARILHETFQVRPQEFEVLEEVGGQEVKRFRFSNGGEFLGDDLGPIREDEHGPIHLLRLQMDDEFYLVNIMDDITKFATLCQEWQLEVRELTEDEMEEFEVVRVAQEKRQRIQVLEKAKQLPSGPHGDWGALDDEKIRDLIAILSISTYYHHDVGFAIDPERDQALHRLYAFLNECYEEKEIEVPVLDERGNVRMERRRDWFFDRDKYETAYGHCCLKGEFPYPFFERIRWAYYFRTVRGMEKIRSKDGRYHETWSYYPVVDITPESRQKYVEDAQRDLAEARKANEEYNAQYRDTKAATALFRQICKRALEMAEELDEGKKKKRNVASVRHIRRVGRVAQSRDRKLIVFTSDVIKSYYQMSRNGRMCALLSEAMEEILDDPACAVVVKPAKVMVDRKGEEAEEERSTGAEVGV